MLIDTSVLVRWANSGDQQHSIALNALDLLAERAEPILIGPQCLYEFWVVATRPEERNGLGWSTGATNTVLDEILDMFLMIEEGPAVFLHWKNLVSQHKVSGRQAHDTRLVALMQTAGETSILTFNGDDFKRFPAIVPIHPAEVT